jgi:hypothetical protein
VYLLRNVHFKKIQRKKEADIKKEIEYIARINPDIRFPK